MPRIRIESLNDERLDVFRDLKRSNQTRWRNHFIAEGTTLVERVFQSPYEVHAVLASEQKLGNFADRIPDHVLVYEVSRDLASQVVGFKFHLGVMAAGLRKLPPRLGEVLPSTGRGLVLFGDHMIDPENVGMLIRIGAAFGADAIVLSEGSADAFSRRVLRVSMGNGLFVPVVENIKADVAVDELHGLGFSCLSTVLSREAKDLGTYQFPKRTALVFGNETHGVKQEIIAKSEDAVTIPMLNNTDSLNVAVACGIFSHSYRCQHPAENHSS